MKSIWNYVNGKKTYIVSFLAAVYGAGIQQGLWPHSEFMNFLLLGGAAAALRHAISKAGNGNGKATTP